MHFDAFFAAVRRALAPDGVALLHAIGRCSPPSATNAWIAKYIFPGGYCPGLSEVFPAIERSGLWATDVEIQRLHYAETLRHWSGRFAAHRDDIAGIYDERFCRMFEFYLAASEASFRTGGMMVFQIQLTADVHALPITRDYMLDAEQSAAAASDRPDATGRAPPQNPPQNAPQNAPSARARHQDPVAMTPVAMTPVAMRTDGDGS